MNRKAICAALVAAKKLVSHTYRNRDKEQFICHALARVRHRTSDLQMMVGCDEAERIIMKRITTRWYTVEHWLENKIGWATFEAARNANRNVVQEYRHLWLDSLIKEFSK
jgi:hypothetical protein